MYNEKKQGLWSWYRRQHTPVKIIVGCPVALVSMFIVLFVVLFIVALVVTAVSPPKSTSVAPTATAKPTATRAVPSPTPKPTPTSKPVPTPRPTPTPQPSHYPPKTLADLRSLAAKGDASQISEFHSESTGATGACPQPKREVTVDASLTGQQLAEDLLAYFYAQQLDNPCGSVVFADHNQSEADGPYTAGRISLSVTDSSGALNFDPNGTNLKYTFTLDIGDSLNGQEYIVTYTK